MLYTHTSIGTVYTIATDRSAGTDYTMYVNVPSATTLPPDFEGSPSVTMSPYTVTGTLIFNGDSCHFETSDDSPVYFYVVRRLN
ncbi:hypothetical protein K435DRAFT_782312 [Dendrothele bispora CBS 962.96]|uniref:Uncharacterized protein n=1 Tax=Dendrothele bispora (strain CBS 962.96) TaxID=1314807 RepID=A0A4S8LFQ8_DENBC|nr:hypothetical protein K435DRAFT_782312 [Dendrothele bispora CBS 962.96]